MSQEKVVRHPNTEALFRDAAERWNYLRKRHAESERLMWAGTLVTQFTDTELLLLRRVGFLCERDEQILRQIGERTVTK